MLSLKGPIARSTLRTTVVYGCRILTQASLLLLVARLLPPDAYGAFASTVALAYLLGALTNLGAPVFLLSRISKDISEGPGIMSFAVTLSLINGVILSLVFFTLTAVFDYSVPGGGGLALVVIALTEIVVQPLISYPAMFWLASDRVAISQLAMNSSFFVRLALLVPISLSNADNKLMLYLFACLAASIVVLATASRLQRIWPPLTRWRLPRLPELKQTLSYALTTATNIASGELDKILVVKVLAAELAGLYIAAGRVIGALLQPLFAMLISALPRMFRFSVDAPERMYKLFRAIALVTLGYAVVATVFIWLAAPWIEKLFGNRYAHLGDTIRVMCWLAPCLISRLAFCNVLLSLHRPLSRALVEASGLLMLFISFALPTQLGLYRMLSAQLVAEAFMALMAGSISYWHIRRSLAASRAAQPSA